MKFMALALDFDGTIATNDTLAPGVREAIADLRLHGITVVLVTGRILDDLVRLLGDLHFVDAIVAENGAFLAFPDSGYEAPIGQPPPAVWLDALRVAGISFRAGRSVVEADARDAPRMLAIIQQLELALSLAFNRGRVMALPPAISKATGLREALTILRLSPHNTLAIGDAENDHELLRICEVGIAVAWGSEALKAVADGVLPGDGPAAVPAYLRTLIGRQLVPTPRRTRRQLLLGHTSDGTALGLAVRGRNVLVAGDTKSGKSWVTGLLCEQLILHGYCLCILDPEGDYTALEALPGVVVYGGADPLPRPRDLLRALRHPDMSVVIDLSHAPHEEKCEFMDSVLPGLASLRRHTGLPHRIVLDEAHHFLQGSEAHGLLDLALQGYTLVSYRASRLPREVLTSSQAIIVTRESDPAEIRALYDLCRSCDERLTPESWDKLFESLVIGEAVMLPVTEETGGVARRIHLNPRLTPHVRHLAKYVDIPVPDGRAFVFWRDGKPRGVRARTLREFVSVIERSSAADLRGHLARGDFSRWLADVFGDYPLAKSVRALEDEARVNGAADVAANLAQTVRSRYELFEPIPHSSE